MRRFDADVAIVGAGPAGQALAIALAQTGFEVSLIDTATGPPTPAGAAADLRVFALSPASTRLLASVGAWPTPYPERVCAYRHMQVWEGDPQDGVRFDAAAMGWASLGHIVEHAVLQHALAQAAARHAQVHSQWHRSVRAIERLDDGVHLQLDDGTALHARLLVGADGARSTVRDLAGITVEQVDYGQRGLVANVRSAVPHDATARQRFLPTGPLALLPLADGASSIVWSLPTEACRRLESVTADVFERELAVASGGVLGTFALLGARAGFPLMRQLVSHYHAQRVLLIGDAAHVVHPLAGQGLNLGFLDVAALVDVLASARRRGLDIGGDGVLSRYGRWRQGDNTLAALAFEGIDRFYRVSPGMARGFRSLGQRIVDRAPALKRRFMLHASGLAGRVPSRCLALPVESMQRG